MVNKKNSGMSKVTQSLVDSIRNYKSRASFEAAVSAVPVSALPTSHTHPPPILTTPPDLTEVCAVPDHPTAAEDVATSFNLLIRVRLLELTERRAVGAEA